MVADYSFMLCADKGNTGWIESPYIFINDKIYLNWDTIAERKY